MASSAAGSNLEEAFELERLGGDALQYYTQPEPVEEEGGDEEEGADLEVEDDEEDSPTSLRKMRDNTSAVLAADDDGIAPLDETSRGFLQHFDKFATLVQEFGSVPMFNVVEQYDDIKKAKGMQKEPIVELHETRDACAYGTFIKLPAKRPKGSRRLPKGHRANYNGITGSGKPRANQHARGPTDYPDRLLYRAWAIAEDKKSIVFVRISDFEYFKRRFLEVYGPDAAFAKDLPAHHVVMAFLSAFEAVHCARLRNYRGNPEYTTHLDGFTGQGEPEDIIGLNGSDCFSNILRQLQGQQKAKQAPRASAAAAVDDDGDQIIPMERPSKESQQKSAISAMTSGSGARADVYLRKDADWGELNLPKVLTEKKVSIHLSKSDLTFLGLNKMRKPSKRGVRVHLERRAQDAEPLAFNGRIDDARFFVRYNLVVEHMLRKLVLSWLPERGGRTSCPETVSKIVAVFATHLGRAALDDVPRPSFVPSSDLVLTPAAEVSTWTPAHRIQVEEAAQGRLSRAVYKERKFLIFELMTTSKGSLKISVANTTDEKNAKNLQIFVCARPNGDIYTSLQRRDDLTAGVGKDWIKWKGTRVEGLRELADDRRALHSLPKLDKWDYITTGSWPPEVAEERLVQGRFPVHDAAKPLGVRMERPSNVRKGTEEDPVYLEVDVDGEQVWWIVGTTRIPAKMSLVGPKTLLQEMKARRVAAASSSKRKADATEDDEKPEAEKAKAKQAKSKK